jgi:homoserine O-succinyltransferase
VTGLKRHCGSSSADLREHSGKCLTIGLVNNMPDTALEATERQFVSLLNAASAGISIRLMRYALPDIPRGEAAACHIEKFYSSVEDLWDTHLDGLIVTGREPLTPNLKDEPYWRSFTKLLEWAQENTRSTVWSCLAAHAAVLHTDGIGRVRNSEKQSGIFECTRVSEHRLTAGAPSSFRLPHSRWNGLPEESLMDRGYSVLTRTAEAGVDTFVKQQKSLFVYFQGHPEYESDTLLREYRRDAGRYLKGETDAYPSMPRNYFDEETSAALTALQEKAMLSRNEELQGELSSVLCLRSIENTWQSTAAGIYKNWLEYIRSKKEIKLQPAPVNIIVGAQRVTGPAAI